MARFLDLLDLGARGLLKARVAVAVLDPDEFALGHHPLELIVPVEAPELARLEACLVDALGLPSHQGAHLLHNIAFQEVGVRHLRREDLALALLHAAAP